MNKEERKRLIFEDKFLMQMTQTGQTLIRLKWPKSAPFDKEYIDGVVEFTLKENKRKESEKSKLRDRHGDWARDLYTKDPAGYVKPLDSSRGYFTSDEWQRYLNEYNKYQKNNNYMFIKPRSVGATSPITPATLASFYQSYSDSAGNCTPNTKNRQSSGFYSSLGSTSINYYSTPNIIFVLPNMEYGIRCFLEAVVDKSRNNCNYLQHYYIFSSSRTYEATSFSPIKIAASKTNMSQATSGYLKGESFSVQYEGATLDEFLNHSKGEGMEDIIYMIDLLKEDTAWSEISTSFSMEPTKAIEWTKQICKMI